MSDDLAPLRSTGIGSWPGTDLPDAIKITIAECPDLPYLPELPARGPHARLVGRSTAFLAGMAVDLQPAGWRLTDGSGRDHRLAIGTLRSDLDHLEEQAQGYAGRFKIAVGGPWTLAAMMERPRGDRVLADHGARRDLGQSLAEGVTQLIVELRRRLPDLDVVLQLDEPLLPAVIGGRIPTASGFSRHRAVDLPEVSGMITHIVEMVDDAAGTPVVVHSCAAEVPVGLLHRAGVRGVSLDLDQVATRDWDEIGPALESGLELWLGALPTNRSLGPDAVAKRTLTPLRALQIDPAVSARLVVTPACGLASTTRENAVASLRAVRRAAAIVTEQLAD